MTKEAILLLANDFAREKLLMAEQGKTSIAKNIAVTRQGMLSNLKNIGKSGNLETIIVAEKSFVENDLKEHANSKNMASSLKTAQEELEAIGTGIGLVENPKSYKIVSATHEQQKRRDSQDLPLDGARTAFRSHNARLVNYDKTKSDDHEKAIIQARRQNIKIAEKLYIERQEKALGRESGEQRKERLKAQPKQG
jgi:hypothetical protein